MHLPSLIEIPLRLLLLIGGFIVPGSMLMRALRLPWSLAAAFVISSASLYVAVLVFTFTGTTISLTTLTVALGLITLAGRLIPTRNYVAPQTSPANWFSQMGQWLPLYLAFWVVVGYRLAFQPLTGPDVYFRWSHLAEQMLKFGSLDFYPPLTGADFSRYFWVESIPPGIASLYTWSYGCGGDKNALWTSPVVALQLLSLHDVIWRLAFHWGGEVVARRAVLLAAACPLLTWSFLIGQETGLTALSVAGLVWCLQNSRERNGRSWITLAGIFAIAAASTREYGPVFAVIAIVPIVLMRLPGNRAFLFVAVALPMALAWPLRVWMLTGNPFYSMDVGGYFPTNPIFTKWSEMFHQPVSNTFSAPENWQMLARYCVLWALPATVGLVALLFLLIRRLKEARLVALFVLVTGALWILSVPHTAGGLFYSMRVLSPALALLAVAGSYGLGLFNGSAAAKSLVAIAIAIMSVEALPKTLVLPENPYREALRDWPQAGRQFPDSVSASEPKVLSLIRWLPKLGQRKLLTDIGGLPRLLESINVEAVPLWSPDMVWLFDSTIKPEDIARRWQKMGLVYVVIGKESPTGNFMHNFAQLWSPYFTVVPIIDAYGLVIFQVEVRTELLTK